jgi:hypothetical protein
MAKSASMTEDKPTTTFVGESRNCSDSGSPKIHNGRFSSHSIKDGNRLWSDRQVLQKVRTFAKAL